MNKTFTLLFICISLIKAEFIEHRFSRHKLSSFSIDLDHNLLKNHHVDSLIKQENDDISFCISNESIQFISHFPIHKINSNLSGSIHLLEGNKISAVEPNFNEAANLLENVSVCDSLFHYSFSERIENISQHLYWLSTSDSIGRILWIYDSSNTETIIIRSWQTTQSHFTYFRNFIFASSQVDPLSNMDSKSIIYQQPEDTYTNNISESYDSGSVTLSLYYRGNEYNLENEIIYKFSPNLPMIIYSNIALLPWMCEGPEAALCISKSDKFGYSENSPDAYYFPNDVPESNSYDKHYIIESYVYENEPFGFMVSSGLSSDIYTPLFVRDSTGRHFRFTIKSFIERYPKNFNSINLFNYFKNDYSDEEYKYPVVSFTLSWMADSAGNGKFDPTVSKTSPAININNSKISTKLLPGKGIQISTNSPKNIFTVSVMNLRGQIIHHESGTGSLLISHKKLSAGAYIMKSKSMDGVQKRESIHRFIVN